MQAYLILENLRKICPQSTLHLDILFIQTLQEELDVFWKENSTIEETNLSFKFSKEGSLIYEGIDSKEIDVLNIPITSPEKTKLASKIEEKKHKILDYLLKQKDSNEN